MAERLAVIGQGSDQRSSISSVAEPVVEEIGGGPKNLQEIFYVNRNNSAGHPGQMSQ